MAQPPLTILEKKWASAAQSNTLIAAATQTDTRQTIPFLDYDTHRNISTLGRRVLLSTGRYLWANCSAVRGAVGDIARFSVASYTPSYYGRNEAWGKQTEDWLSEGDDFIDMRGAPFTMDILRRNLVYSAYREGGVGWVLTEDENGNSKIQTVRAHRIGCRMNETSVLDKESPYFGERIIDGVILDDRARTLAFRVYGENPWDLSYTDVPANSMSLAFMPEYEDQVREISLIGAAAFDFQDLSEVRSFEFFAQKLAASKPVNIWNEMGTVDTSKTRLNAPTTPPTATGALQDLPTQKMTPGVVTYFRSGKGDKMEFPVNDRPSQNVMNFQDELIRTALNGMGWAFDFSHNPTKAGGAQMRVVIERINAAAAEVQKLLVRPLMKRVTAWRVAKGIKQGRIPADVDWHKWDFQGPAEVTADEKNTSDVAINEIRAGIASPQQVIERRTGKFWEDIQDQQIAYRKRLERRCLEEGVDAEKVVWPGPNGVPPENGAGPAEAGTTNEQAAA